MKVITLTAPWSWLAATRLKQWETRSWRTSYRGLLGIHTAQSLAPVGGEQGLIALCSRPYFYEAMIVMGVRDPLAAPRGCIIAVCNLRDIQPVEMVRDHIDPAERAFGDYTDGRFAWQLDGAAQLRLPIVVSGKQGLWNWGDYPFSIPTTHKEVTHVQRKRRHHRQALAHPGRDRPPARRRW